MNHSLNSRDTAYTRAKTAAQVYPIFLRNFLGRTEERSALEAAARLAVNAADILMRELERKT